MLVHKKNFLKIFRGHGSQDVGCIILKIIKPTLTKFQEIDLWIFMNNINLYWVGITRDFY